MTERPPKIRHVSIPGGLRGMVAIAPDTPSACQTPLPDDTAWCKLLPSVVSDPAELPGYQTLKYSGGGEVFRATLIWESRATAYSIDVVCKKSVSPRGLKGLTDSLRTSRARKNFDRALLLIKAGITTPVPLAAIDRAKPGANWLITEFLPDLIDLDRIALVDLPQLPRNELRAAKNSLIAATSDLFACLYRYGLSHRDLKASNILIEGWRSPHRATRTVLVDLDGLARTSRLTTDRWKPLVRLSASLLDYPSLTRGDFVRFLKSYLTTTNGGSSWRTHFHRLARSATRYAQKSRARKTHKLDGYT